MVFLFLPLYIFISAYGFSYMSLHEISMTPSSNQNCYCGSSTVYMFADPTVLCDVLLQHSECAAAYGNAGGVSIEGIHI